MNTTIHRLAVGALALSLGVAGMVPALADHDEDAVDEAFTEEEPFQGSLGGLLDGGLLSGLPVVSGLGGGEGGLLGGLLGSEGGLLGDGGLLGSEGGLLPGLLGGHAGVPEFTEGTATLVDGLTSMAELLPGAPPVDGEHVGEGSHVGGGVLGGLLSLEGLVGGLAGRL